MKKKGADLKKQEFCNLGRNSVHFDAVSVSPNFFRSHVYNLEQQTTIPLWLYLTVVYQVLESMLYIEICLIINNLAKVYWVSLS